MWAISLLFSRYSFLSKARDYRSRTQEKKRLERAQVWRGDSSAVFHFRSTDQQATARSRAHWTDAEAAKSSRVAQLCYP